MNVKLITFANYSGNAKSSDTSKGLKYGDLEIRLINDKYYFVHKNGAIIDNIQTILMKSGAFNGLMSTMPTSITEDLINYAPSMNLLMSLVFDFVKREELQNGTFAANLKSLTVNASALNQKSVQVTYGSDLIYMTGYSLVIDASNKSAACFDITNRRTGNGDYTFFNYNESNRSNYSCQMRFGCESGQAQLRYDNENNQLELGTVANYNILSLHNDSVSVFKGHVTMPSLTSTDINVETLNGYNISGTGASATVPAWPHLATVKTDGVMEVGRYLDFHTSSGGDGDYKIRVDSSGGTLKLQSANSSNHIIMAAYNGSQSSSSYTAFCLGKAASKNNAVSIQYKNNLGRLGFYSNDGIIEYDTSKNVSINGPLTLSSSITLNNQNINKVSTSTNYDFDNFSDNEMLTALCIKNLFNTRPPIEHTHILSEITDYEPPDLSPYAKQTDIEPLYDDVEELAKNKANIVHNHLSEDITDMKETIETTNYSTLTVGTLTNTTINTETVNAGVININNQSLDEVLDTKADVGHKHTTEDITNIEDYVNNLINAKQQSFIDEAFKAIYPIGSIYISHVDPLYDVKWKKHKGTEQHIQYEWHGCIWEYIDDYVFLRNSGRYQNALIWYENYRDYGKRGGSDSHSHTIAGHSLTGNELPNLKFQWRANDYNSANVNYINVGASKVKDTPKWESGSSDFVVQKEYKIEFGSDEAHSHDCGESSNLPPYLNVYMYKRIE